MNGVLKEIKEKIELRIEELSEILKMDIGLFDPELNIITGTGSFNFQALVWDVDSFMHYDRIEIDNGELVGTLFIAGEENKRIKGVVFDHFVKSLIKEIGSIAQAHMYKNKIEDIEKIKSEIGEMAHRGILVLDSNWDIVYMNHRAEQIIGCQIKQISYLKKIKQFSISYQKTIDEETQEYAVKLRGETNFLTGNLREIYEEGSANKKVWKYRVFSFIESRTWNENFLERSKQRAWTLESIIGESRIIKRTIEQCKNYAYVVGAVTIYGEKGTGREVYARAMHNERGLKPESFIKIEPGGAMENLVEKSILDGTVLRVDGMPIKYDSLSGKTVFVDEIGDLNPKEQNILLSIIESCKLTDTRIACATSQSMEDICNERRLREDLCGVLSSRVIFIPPLRQRDKDSLHYVKHYLKKYNEVFNRQIDFADDVMDLLGQYHWPGNIREVENVVAEVISSMDQSVRKVTMKKFPNEIKERLSRKEKNNYNLESIERETIIRVLNEVGIKSGHKEEAAKKMGISRATLYRKMKEYEIRPKIVFGDQKY